MVQVFPATEACDAVAVHPVAVPVCVIVTPDDPVGAAAMPTYVLLSENHASFADTRFFKSDFMAVRYAFCFVSANFGIAMAAKMPMMTTTISSSISVKPFRVRFMLLSEYGRGVRSRGRTAFRPLLKQRLGQDANHYANGYIPTPYEFYDVTAKFF